MDIRIYSRNLNLSDESESYIQKKLKRIERHLKPISDAKIELSRTSVKSQAERFVARMTISTNGRTLRGENSGETLFSAIDGVVDVMDRQTERHKDQLYRSSKGRKAARLDERAEQAFETADLDDATLLELGQVVRTKRFAMHPMTVTDAVSEMESIGHSFFLFFNVESDEYNLLYRRYDGDYGVIEPELTA